VSAAVIEGDDMAKRYLVNKYGVSNRQAATILNDAYDYNKTEFTTDDGATVTVKYSRNHYVIGEDI
jgi:hypothetical protein